MKGSRGGSILFTAMMVLTATGGCAMDAGASELPSGAPDASASPMADATVPSAATGPDIAGMPLEASSRAGPFVLEIRSSQDRYRAGQVIQIAATLDHRGTSGDTYRVYGPSSGLFGFRLASSDGTVMTDLVSTADCTEHVLRTGQQFPFVKNGGWSDASPPFIRSYFEHPREPLRLPAGRWTVTAQAGIHLTDGCRDDQTTLSASVTITVVP